MAEIKPIVMPKWGLSMQAGMLAAWHVAEGQVHGPVEGSGLRHRRVRLLDRGGQQARPRRRVIAHEVALEQVAGLPDGQAFQQRRHPRGTNVGTLLPGGGDVLVSHSVTSRASAGLDTP